MSVTFGLPGKSTLNPSSLLTNSSHSWAAAPPAIDSTNVMAMATTRMNCPPAALILQGLGTGDKGLTSPQPPGLVPRPPLVFVQERGDPLRRAARILMPSRVYPRHHRRRVVAAV